MKFFKSIIVKHIDLAKQKMKNDPTYKYLTNLVNKLTAENTDLIKRISVLEKKMSRMIDYSAPVYRKHLDERIEEIEEMIKGWYLQDITMLRNWMNLVSYVICAGWDWTTTAVTNKVQISTK